MAQRKEQAAQLERLGSIVDQLGELKAMISNLTHQEKLLKQTLILSNQPEINGEVFRATISKHERVTLDSDSVRLFLTESQLVSCQVISDVTTVRIVAKIRN